MIFDQKEINAFYKKQKNFTGGNYNELYLRFQNDQYLKSNLSKIRNRKTQYKFKLPKLPKAQGSLSLAKLRTSGNNYQQFKEQKDSEVLYRKIADIFQRHKRQYNQDFFTTKEIKAHNFNRVRNNQKKKIIEENYSYRSRILNTNSTFSREALSKFVDNQKGYSINLRKMFPDVRSETASNCTRKTYIRIKKDDGERNLNTVSSFASKRSGKKEEEIKSFRGNKPAEKKQEKKPDNKESGEQNKQKENKPSENKSAEKPVEKSAEKPVEKLEEKPAEIPAEKPEEANKEEKPNNNENEDVVEENIN